MYLQLIIKTKNTLKIMINKIIKDTKMIENLIIINIKIKNLKNLKNRVIAVLFININLQ